MLMKLFQLVVVFLVMAANIHWQLTPNGYAAGFAAVILAYWATLLVGGLAMYARRLRR